MADPTIKIRGVQPLAWGTVVVDGYVNESTGEDEGGEEVLIADEGGDTCTQITGFGLKTDVTLEVIPKQAVVAPVVGDVFAYGTSKISVLGISKKRVNKNVEKWTIKGNRFPNVPLTV